MSEREAEGEERAGTDETDGAPTHAGGREPGTSPPLLSVAGLTIRFGGLTAVREVDFSVHAGEIYAVIGPNGAGKTTVFNAITGIYEPSEGTIQFDGRDVRKPFRRSQLVTFGLAGLLLALGMLLFAANVDGLWTTAIKHNFLGRETGFDPHQALADGLDYLAAKPRIELRAGRHFVTTFDGERAFGSVADEVQAEVRLRQVAELGKRGDAAIVERDELFAIVDAAGTQLGEPVASRASLDKWVEPALAAEARAAGARRTRVVVFLLSLLLGAGGAYSAWRQSRRTPAWVASRGIARTFQNIRLFQHMTVMENVLVGMDQQMVERGRSWPPQWLFDALTPTVLAALLAAAAVATADPEAAAGLPTVLLALFALGLIIYAGYLALLGSFSRAGRRAEADALTRGSELLEFVGLEDRADEISKNLAYGDQRRLEIARALATRPQLLLLDEPAAGMNPAESVSLMHLIRAIRDTGVTVLLIEHHMRVVMGISDRISVLEYGRKIAEGTPDEVRANARVIEAYLGKEEQG